MFASSLYINLFGNISGIMIWENHSGFVHNNCKGVLDYVMKLCSKILNNLDDLWLDTIGNVLMFGILSARNFFSLRFVIEQNYIPVLLEVLKYVGLTFLALWSMAYLLLAYMTYHCRSTDIPISISERTLKCVRDEWYSVKHWVNEGMMTWKLFIYIYICLCVLNHRLDSLLLRSAEAIS